MKTFDALIRPMPRDEFLGTHFAKEPLFIGGPTDKFHDLVSWTDVNLLLEQDVLFPNRLKLFRDGKEVASNRFEGSADADRRISAAGLTSCLSEGSTLIIDRVDRVLPSVRVITEQVEEAFRTGVSTNLYAGWTTKHGFNLHWDSQDVLILQVAGDKEWVVHKPTRLHPLEGETPRAPEDEPHWSGVLAEGDALWIPRGWWHMARPQGHPTLHLTVTIVPPTGADYLKWLQRRSCEASGVRANLPNQLDASASNALHRHLVSRFNDVDPDVAIREFADDWWARVRARPRFALPHGPLQQSAPITDTTLVALALTRGLSKGAETNGTITVSTDGIEMTCPATLWPALRTLSSSQSVPVGELASQLATSNGRRELLIVLSALSMRGGLWLNGPQQPS